MASTVLAHAVFFGSGRYSMVVFPLVTALAFCVGASGGPVATGKGTCEGARGGPARKSERAAGAIAALF
jgi:hypothetical protein